MKKCRFCAEEIQDAAVKCRYCGEWLEEEPANGKPANRVPSNGAPAGDAGRPASSRPKTPAMGVSRPDEGAARPASNEPMTISDLLASGRLKVDPQHVETLPGNLGLTLEKVRPILGRDQILLSWHCSMGDALVVTTHCLILIKAGMVGGSGTALVARHEQVQRITVSKSFGSPNITVHAIDLHQKPFESSYNHVALINNRSQHEAYAMALLSLIRPLQGAQSARQPPATSVLGTAAAVAGGIALAELATSHQTVTTTVDAVVELSDATSGVGSAHEVITTTTEVAGGIFSSIWDYLFG